MMKKQHWSLALLPFLLFFTLIPSGLAEEHEQEDLEIYGIEVEKLLNLGSGIVAAVLFLLTLLAYKRTHNARLKYVSIAFFLFAVKSLLMGVEIFIGEVPGVDLITSSLDFAILLSFFFGIIKE